MAANRAEFLANCGSRLDHSKAVTACVAKTLGPAMRLSWAGSKGRATGKPRALPTWFLHKFKSFLSSHASSRLPLKPLNLPSLHAQKTGKREAVYHSQFPCHHTDSFMHKPRRVAGSVPDLFMT